MVVAEIAACECLEVGELVNRLQCLDIVHSLITHAPLELTTIEVGADILR